MLSLIVTTSAAAGRCIPRRFSTATILGTLPPLRLMFIAIAITALAIPALRHHPRLAVLKLELILRTGRHVTQAVGCRYL